LAVSNLRRSDRIGWADTAMEAEGSKRERVFEVDELLKNLKLS
jgi:hypothetical protein